MLDFKLLNSQAFLNGELIFRAFLRKRANQMAETMIKVKQSSIGPYKEASL